MAAKEERNDRLRMHNYLIDWEKLPENIQEYDYAPSNRYRRKLIKKMSETNYTPYPIDTSDIVLSPELLELTEKIATNVHDVLAAGRLKDGWTYGAVRNNTLKQHPCLVPYDAMPDSEKKYDRNTAMETLKVIEKLGFEILKNEIICKTIL
jgi:hypothetical protein